MVLARLIFTLYGSDKYYGRRLLSQVPLINKSFSSKLYKGDMKGFMNIGLNALVFFRQVKASLEKLQSYVRYFFGENRKTETLLGIFRHQLPDSFAFQPCQKSLGALPLNRSSSVQLNIFTHMLTDVAALALQSKTSWHAHDRGAGFDSCNIQTVFPWEPAILKLLGVSLVRKKSK